MRTFDLGPLYVAAQVLPGRVGIRLAARSVSAETEPPYRRGSCLLVRLPRTRLVLVLGWWSNPSDDVQDDVLAEALGYRTVEEDELDVFELAKSAKRSQTA